MSSASRKFCDSAVGDCFVASLLAMTQRVNGCHCERSAAISTLWSSDLRNMAPGAKRKAGLRCPAWDGCDARGYSAFFTVLPQEPNSALGFGLAQVNGMAHPSDGCLMDLRGSVNSNPLSAARATLRWQ